jgi:hypothetical protein
VELCQSGNCVGISEVHWINRCDLGKSRISGRAKNGHSGVRRQPRNERVLAPTTAKYENSHFFSDLRRTGQRRLAARPWGRFR